MRTMLRVRCGVDLIFLLTYNAREEVRFRISHATEKCNAFKLSQIKIIA